MDNLFARLKGPEILKFITNTTKIITFFKSNFEATDIMKDLCKVLKLWEEITPFLLITEIKDVDKYKDLLNLWEKLEEFYVVGGRTILTKNPANAGDDETFYFHVLRFYLPKIAKKNNERK